MRLRCRYVVVFAIAASFASAPSAFGLANRVFVSQRTGNNAASCDNILTPCQTLAGAVLQLNPGGEAIVLDSGGYGPVTITKSVTVEAPAGVIAFVHPASGDAITVNAGSGAVVILRGLTLSAGTGNGIAVQSVGALYVENCSITGFSANGVAFLSPGRLNVTGTTIRNCGIGVLIQESTGLVQASIDHCHLDGNGNGFEAVTTSPGASTTTATYTTANNNAVDGWAVGDGGNSGLDVLSLEFCSGSENGDSLGSGLQLDNANATSTAGYSNCIFSNNKSFGVLNVGSGAVVSRGDSTVTGNPTGGPIGSFPAK